MLNLFKFRRHFESNDYLQLRSNLLQQIELAEYYIGRHNKLSHLIINAKDEYIQLTGRIKESDDGYFQRVKSYIYWFMFDWKIPPQHQTLAINQYINSIENSEQKATASMLLNNELALYFFDKHTKHGVIIFNLFNNKKIEIADNDSFQGFNHGDLFETRLIKVNENYIFLDYFILHPQVILKSVKKYLKGIKDKPDMLKNLIFQLQASFVKWKTYKMIDERSIYKFLTTKIN